MLRVPPPSAHSGLAPSRPRPDPLRLAQAGLVAGLAQGGPLGLSFALCAWTRAHGRPHMKVFSGFAPMVAAFLTAPAEQGLRAGLGIQPTWPRQPSLAHDAIPGAVLFLATLAWQRLPGPPRPLPTSPAGMAATVAVSMLGSLVGGVLCEVSAQRSQAPEDGPRPAAAPPHPLPFPAAATAPRAVPAIHKGLARALTLLPLAIWLQLPAGLATAGRPLPRWTGLASTGVACVGWTFRRLLTTTPAADDRENPVDFVEVAQSTGDASGYHRAIPTQKV